MMESDVDDVASKEMSIGGIIKVEEVDEKLSSKGSKLSYRAA